LCWSLFRGKELVAIEPASTTAVEVDSADSGQVVFTEVAAYDTVGGGCFHIEKIQDKVPAEQDLASSNREIVVLKRGGLRWRDDPDRGGEQGDSIDLEQ